VHPIFPKVETQLIRGGDQRAGVGADGKTRKDECLVDVHKVVIEPVNCAQLFWTEAVRCDAWPAKERLVAEVTTKWVTGNTISEPILWITLSSGLGGNDRKELWRNIMRRIAVELSMSMQTFMLKAMLQAVSSTYIGIL
jgi:hypothetical protein